MTAGPTRILADWLIATHGLEIPPEVRHEAVRSCQATSRFTRYGDTQIYDSVPVPMR